jgi:hypothetical protein
VLGFGRPSSVVEFPFDTARNITNGLYTGLFQRLPRLRLILAHCGGVLPSLAWRIGEHTVVRNIANLTSFDGFTAQELSGVERDNALPLFPRFA